MKKLNRQTIWMIIIPLLLFYSINMLLDIDYWWILVVTFLIVWTYKSIFEDPQEIQEIIRNTGAVLILLLILPKLVSLDVISESFQFEVILPLLGISIVCSSICFIRGAKYASNS